MTHEHEHDWWRKPNGSLECACGASRWPWKREESEEDG